ncbi:MAG TPA: hypothetical protein VN285_06125 [Candidatus Deferrimicrobium sp.]|nr:hypothetical protein [Candidatus Deferrimicrobium sp.]
MNGKRFAMCAAVLALASVGTSHAAPRMVIPESTFDFGFVPQHSVVSHVFWLMSEGDDTLKILNVNPG